MRRPSDHALRKLYDSKFEEVAEIHKVKPGSPHYAGLRAVYDRGRADGAKQEREDQGLKKK